MTALSLVGPVMKEENLVLKEDQQFITSFLLPLSKEGNFGLIFRQRDSVTVLMKSI